MATSFRSRLFAIALALLAAVPTSSAHARDREQDHDRARAALSAGEIVPLAAILETVEREFIGSLLEVELEHEHGRWVYEVKLLSSQGAVLKLLYDARTRTLIRTKGHGVDQARRSAP